MPLFSRASTVAVGDPAPPLALPDAAGTVVDLAEVRGRWAVVYFYPADDTPGCTAEACAFRDAYEDFTDAGAVVLGVSGDDAASHRAFTDKHNLPFTLLSDADGSARRAWGVSSTLGMPGRVTFVIDPQGAVRLVFSSQLRATRHITEALEAIRADA